MYPEAPHEYQQRSGNMRFVLRGDGYAACMQIDTTLLPAHGNDAVEILLNDHRVIENLLEELDGASGNELKGVLERLKGVLTIHNATEENLVYPALDKVAGSRLEAQHLYHETSEADTLLFEVASSFEEGDDDTLEAKIRQLTDAVRHHIDEEERKAFPRLRENADAPHVERLAESVRNFRKSIHFDVAEA
jgi:hemerythrin superfamily protein